MKSCAPRNTGLPYIVLLIVCQILDYVTSGTLSFLNLTHPAEIVEVIFFEDVLAAVISLTLAACLIIYLVASQTAVSRAILVATVLSTVSLLVNVGGLVRSLMIRQVNPWFLLVDAALTYASTVLLFSVWYWILDADSQQARCEGRPTAPVLVFPQNATKITGYENWVPGSIDYVCHSFHTSSTLGPTDTLVLSGRGKVVMILQVTLSLVILIVLAARAIGLLD